jgi:DNA-binding transcriptional LysR family regulator
MISRSLNLKQLEALIWVADLGSFRKAAAHLNTTQPNISTRIARLEAALGTPLMRRDAGSVQMTPKGAEILAQARKTLRAAEALVDIAARPDLIEDRLRLGVTELVACTWLRAFLRRLKAVYPRISVELNVDLSRNLDTELAGNALDLALQNAPFGSAVAGEIGLGSYPYIWVASPEISKEINTDTGVTAVTVPILTHARHTLAYQELSAHFDGRAGAAARLVPSSSLTSSIHMAVDGMGLAVVPRAMVAAQLAEGSLVALAMDWHPQPLQFAARFHADRAAGFVHQAAALAVQVARAEDH